MKYFFTCMVCAAVVATTFAGGESDKLLEGFRNPPVSARPRTWWHWMHGYVTREGITADLEAMKEQGLGGFTLFDVGYWPEIRGRVKTLSEEWYDLVLFAGREAERLGLKMGVHNCPGWTSAGGPWIRPEEAMKDYVCIECKNGVIPKADERTIAILAVPELPSDAVEVPDFKLKSFVGNLPFDNGHYKTNVIKNVPSSSVIPKNRIINLTRGGEIPTDGKWIILHFKWQVKNVLNHPASNEGRGLECDKMSKEGVDAALRGMLTRIVSDQRKAGISSIETTLIDSYERGPQSWTQRMPEEFKARRGYDLIPFLPVLSGRYVESGEATEQFLRDLRRTNADLFAHWFGGYFVKKSNELGLKVEIEPYPGHFDELLQASFADIPMGEFWRGGVNNTGWSAMVGAVGRAWRRKIVQTESFTSGMKRTDGWAVTPGMLKRQGDAALAKGVNRFVFHTFAHQPWKGPIASAGIVMGPWGMDFNRANMLWPYFKPWVEYLGRANFLLQQGHGVSDVLYVGGDDPPVRFTPPHIPYGYQLDAVDSFHYRRDAKVDSDGMTVLPSGQKYRYVVKSGDVFKPNGLLPDFMVDKAFRNNIAWLHRRLDDGSDLYFVSNLSESFMRFTSTHRTQSAVVELWNAENGSISKAVARTRDDGRTDVDIALGPAESVFVLFRESHTKGVKFCQNSIVEDVESVMDLSRGWSVKFQPGRGAPPSAQYDILQSFSESENDGIKYFSGESLYSRSFTVDSKIIADGNRYFLDLGEVYDVCKVKVNGCDRGIVWRKPWRIDVTSALKGGENTLEITVVNKWSNRMIGDERKDGIYPGKWNTFRDKLYLQGNYPPLFAAEGRSPDGYYAYSTLRTFRKDDKLFPAGLLGPVRLVTCGE